MPTFREVIEPLVKEHAGFLSGIVMNKVEKEFKEIDEPYNREKLIALVEDRFPMLKKYEDELPQ